MATQLDPTIFDYQNFYSALLTADITAGSLTIALDTVPSATSGILVIDPDSSTSREVILYTSKGVSNVVCPSDGRGWDGSTATSHLTGTTVIMADVAYYFKKLASGELSTDPLRTTLFFDHIASGGVVAISSGLIGTFSNIVFYLNGVRYSGTSIANKTYTASKDTYVDITGASGGAVTVLYTEVANNAASPALTTNYIRVAIVTTSGAAITNVNQGQESQVIPIVSSVALSVTDTLGNLICPRDPLRKVLGYKQITSTFTTTSTTGASVTGLTCPVIVPSGRKVKVSTGARYMATSATTGTGIDITLQDATAVAIIGESAQTIAAPGGANVANASAMVTPPASGSRTYQTQVRTEGAGTYSFVAAATTPGYILVELV
jgi:hypothetical protein